MKLKFLIFSLVAVFVLNISLGFGIISNAEEVGIYSSGENVATLTDSISEQDMTEEEYIVDDTLYLSDTYTDKTVNDIYSMVLSCRNVLLVLLFFEVIRWADLRFKTIFQRNK